MDGTKIVRAWVAALIVVLALQAPARAEIINVPAEQPTIQSAINAATDGDEVVVAEGIYAENINLSGKAITVRSTDPADPAVVANTIIDGGGSGSVVTCESGEGLDTVFDGFTITGGSAFRGGGMFNNASSPTVTNCTFTSNWAEDSGGGMFNDFSSPTVTHCTFTGNSAENGGGIANWSNGSPSVTDCTFSGNYAGAGGGIFHNVVGPVTNCTFSDNWAYQGGGMFGGNVVTNCTFRGNTAYEGGGIDSCGTVINCTFTDNSADYGGGMHGCGAMRDCTFSGNMAANGRAVALVDTWPWPPSSLTLANCILRDGGNEVWAIYGTVTASYSNIQGGFAGTGNIDADPLFVEPDNGNLRLQPGSPCIDAGDNTAVPVNIVTDLDGNPRFVDDPAAADQGLGDPPVVDMGAYEFCRGDLSHDGLVNASDLGQLLGAWGPNPDHPADLNNDGTVDAFDLAQLLGGWGPCG